MGAVLSSDKKHFVQSVQSGGDHLDIISES